ncbi:MAG: hypothetical protein ACE5G1_06820 [bacterium]
MPIKGSLVSVLLALVLASCSNETQTLTPQTSGDFALLTYNVAGLPTGISESNPEANTPLMSPLLNRYDIALVQEDFVFHEQLKSRAQHAFQSIPSQQLGQFGFGDGLNRFSIFSFVSFRREAWTVCSNNRGNDCLAMKGFSSAATTIAENAVIDIYNIHLDSGGSQGDFAARLAQVDQLLAAINSQSAGKAVIVAGDTNMNTNLRPQDEQLLVRLLNGAGLVDVCRSLSCGTELVDRVLYRSGTALKLQPTLWQIDAAFVDPQGVMLSDHNAFGVTFSWEAR